MKFIDQLEFHQIPEWLKYYINYNELKHSLKCSITNFGNCLSYNIYREKPMY